MYVVLHTYLTCTKYVFGDDGLDFCATRMSTAASTIALLDEDDSNGDGGLRGHS